MKSKPGDTVAQTILDEATVARLVETMAALNANVQSAAQTSQQINQSIADLLTKQSGQAGQTALGTQQVFEDIGAGERGAIDNADRGGIIFGNLKRTADQAQTMDLSIIKAHQDIYVNAVKQLQTELAHVNNITAQHLQNAVNQAKQLDTVTATNYAEINKNRQNHSDIATDHTWNLEPSQGASEATVLRSVSLDDASLKAIGATVAAALAQSFAAQKP
jgi:hypothetical protein